MVINPIVGVYIPIIRIPIKGGMTIPNIATFDHGTYGYIWWVFDWKVCMFAKFSRVWCEPQDSTLNNDVQATILLRLGMDVIPLELKGVVFVILLVPDDIFSGGNYTRIRCLTLSRVCKRQMNQQLLPPGRVIIVILSCWKLKIRALAR